MGPPGTHACRFTDGHSATCFPLLRVVKRSMSVPTINRPPIAPSIHIGTSPPVNARTWLEELGEPGGGDEEWDGATLVDGVSVGDGLVGGDGLAEGEGLGVGLTDGDGDGDGCARTQPLS